MSSILLNKQNKAKKNRFIKISITIKILQFFGLNDKTPCTMKVGDFSTQKKGRKIKKLFFFTICGMFCDKKESI